MKIKIFECHRADELEYNIQEFINSEKPEIIFILQSSDEQKTTITIIYKEK